MSKTWPALLLAIPALTLSFASTADEASGERGAGLTLSAGREGYAYWNVAERFRKAAGESGLKVEVLASAGSLENLERLDDATSPVNLALAQSDALEQFLDSHHALRNRLDILESIGLECVFMVARADLPVKTDGDLGKAGNLKVALPGKESGTAVTYRILSLLLPGFATTQPVFHDSVAAAMDSLTASGADRADAVMLVHRPKQRTPEIQLALDHPEKYRFVAIPEKRLNGRLPEGQTAYSFEDVPLVRRGNEVEQSVPTVCTKGLLVASTGKLAPRELKNVQRMVAEKWMQIYADDF